jgi:adenosylcobinamide kinase/adenosylcobinamide-phosphate guanylyltransferase
VSPRTLLVLGGVRAGKSAFAVARARALEGRVAFVATARASDPEMAARIARHRAERAPTWRTLEVPVAVPPALGALAGQSDLVIVDCLTLWVANILEERPDISDAELGAEAAALGAVLARRAFTAILVSNEVGWGVHPASELGRRFRDALGLVNQAVARVADEVVLMVAGCPVPVKALAPEAGGGGRPE